MSMIERQAAIEHAIDRLLAEKAALAAELAAATAERDALKAEWSDPNLLATLDRIESKVGINPTAPPTPNPA